MSGAVDVSNLPSWILVILIGLGLSYATSQGILTQYDGIGGLMVLGGLLLGIFYFGIDVLNKV